MKVYALALFVFHLSGVQAADNSASVIMFDMPHGGCRLHVKSDGSAVLAYGALPAQIRVKAGTFQPDIVVKAFKRVVKAQPATGQSQLAGSVSFADAEKLFWFSDKALAQEYFRQALANKEADAKTDQAANPIENTCNRI